MGTAPLVDVHDASISQVIGGQQIEGLPINGRNFISFAVITPGVTQDNTPQQGASATSGLSFAGQRARSNNIMVDGLDNNDATVGSVRAVFSQEAIREFQVLTNSYSAEFGKASGGVVNIVTKSGTNELRGNVFGYFRDKSLNGKDHFEQFDVFGDPVNLEKSPFRQAQFGATLGGPIKKERSFYFLSFERLDQSASNLVTIAQSAADILNAAGFPVTVGANPYDVKQTQFLGKIDHQWAAESNLVVRANYADTTNENTEPFGGLVARSRGAVGSTDYCVGAEQSRGALGERGAGSVRAAGPESQLARSELRRSLSRHRRWRTDAGDCRRRERRTAAVHAAAAPHQPAPGAGNGQPFRRTSPAEERRRIQLHSQRRRAAAALWRTLHLHERGRRGGRRACRLRAGIRHRRGDLQL
jgi:hypothetical protein